MSSGADDDGGSASLHGGYKRARLLGDGGMDASAVDFMRVFMMEPHHQDAMAFELWGRVMAMDSEKRMLAAELEKLVVCKVG